MTDDCYFFKCIMSIRHADNYLVPYLIFSLINSLIIHIWRSKFLMFSVVVFI